MINRIGRLTFIRQIYRRLLERGRTYAAFQRKYVFPLVESLSTYDQILDPMSGYGTLMTYCSEIGIRSFSIELNPPSYYWQVLINPANYLVLQNLLENLQKIKLPSSNSRAYVSDTWFSEESKRLALDIYFSIIRLGEDIGLDTEERVKFALSIYLPFVGRFSSYVQGNMVIDTKPGGICIIDGWETDLSIYLNYVKSRIFENYKKSKNNSHTTLLGDCRTMNLEKMKFSSFLTSPSYPNYKDYYRTFAPENTFLKLLADHDSNYHNSSVNLIGTTDVKSRKNGNIEYIKSAHAKEFLEQLKESKGRKKVENDVQSYYFPFFLNYFIDLQDAYENISKWMANSFTGYIIVVNNTARNHSVPVAEFTLDTFNRIGAKANIIDKRIIAHVGTLNPKAKGPKTRHEEYTIKVSNNDR